MPNRKLSIDNSSLQRARASFDVHYYRWAQEQARREVNEDLATLHMIKNPLVYRFLEIAQAMDKQQRLELFKALVKRAHFNAAESVGETMNTRDEELINGYLNHDTYIEDGIRVVNATFDRRGNDRIYRPVEQRAALPQIDRKRLRTLVVEKLRHNLGEYSVHESPDSWWYETKIGVWSIWTLVAAHKKHVHLSYCHRISVAQGVDLRFPISAMQWLGIGGSTDWSLWNESEVDDATEAMSLLVSRFLDAAPLLLTGVPVVPLHN
jgi:hypothetical protein